MLSGYCKSLFLGGTYIGGNADFVLFGGHLMLAENVWMKQVMHVHNYLVALYLVVGPVQQIHRL